ncbi:serine hydrolase domain-containing protein [Actinokineospora inagensis]|uniref:serine hydrolase domain-containing protein n=1 Tax=Actinokineospora inagensis TaxID=103730 RepID=UPI0003F99149|nr:serine hydrolase domain-containing protein [Actinokineospora inagensis]
MSGHNQTTRRRRITSPRVVAGVLSGTVAACLVTAGPASAQHGDHGLADLVQQDVAAGVPAAFVRVDDGRGRAVEIARQAGWTRRDHELSVQDRVRMGSNTKTVVATLVLQQVAEGKLALTDPVSKWLPGAVPGGDNITLRMLLNHTSGLADYLNNPAVLPAVLGQDPKQWTPQELVAAGVALGPLFTPGAHFSYSNTNYIALGLVLEKATGRSLADLIQDRIARPLRLTNTYLTTANKKGGMAHGYEPDAAHLAPLLPPGVPAGTGFAGPEHNEHVDTTWVNNSTEWAAGGIVSTAEEWARFQSALLSGKLLPPAQLAEMRTTVEETPGSPNRYGLGLEQVTTPCGTVWGHTGSVPGYSTQAYTDPTGRRTVTIFASTVFGLANPKAQAATQSLVDTAVCTMLNKPTPTE